MNSHSVYPHIRDILRKLHVSFPDMMPQYLLAVALPLLNNTPINSSFVSPKLHMDMLNINRYPYLPKGKDKDILSIRKEFNLIIKKVLEKEKIKKDKRLKKFNENKGPPIYNIGDICILKNMQNETKLLPLYSETLYQITNVYTHALQLKRLIDNFIVLRHPKHVKIIKHLDLSKVESATNINDILKNFIPEIDLNLVIDQSKLKDDKVLTRAQKQKEMAEFFDDLDVVDNSIESSSKNKGGRVTFI